MHYFRPTELDDALIWLKENASRNAVIAAGCTDLLPATTAPQLAGPILDVTSVGEIGGIAHDGDLWRIGAATTWTELIEHPLPPAFDALKLAAREIGSVQIQNRATLGGNVCNASPAADGVPCWLSLDASVEVQSAGNKRTLPLSSFLLGPRSTARRPDEIVTAFLVPTQSSMGRSTFLKLGARKHLVISIAMVAARIVSQNERITDAALCVGACSAVARRLPDAERSLVGQPLRPGVEDNITDSAVSAALSPIDDVRADSAYRTHSAVELVRRAVAELAGSDG